MMKAIKLRGCDDHTTIVVEMTESEHQFLLGIEEKINAQSRYC
jgi:hypothetical protein